MSKVILDQESFKALAASTRIDILKLLHKKPCMQAELAKSLEMKPASVNEHLKELIKADLIVQKDEGRKWKYYSLTEKAKCILEPERKIIWITLSVLIFSFLGSIFSYFNGTFNYLSEEMLMEPVMEGTPIMMNGIARKTAEDAMAMPAQSMMQSPDMIQHMQNVQEPNYLLWFFIGVLLISSLILLFLLGKNLIKKRRLNR